jgi:hypothetical protein
MNGLLLDSQKAATENVDENSVKICEDKSGKRSLNDAQFLG